MKKSIMIQGTMSNAGKSLLTAGLCRIFKQDGYEVAPFKSQNMALNSFVTVDGLEMGRAQVMQAEAAGIEPDVLMNPVLLKPTSDVGSQVVVKGEVLGNMGAQEYFDYKKNLRQTVTEAYETLAEQYDIIVIEGAGSPAEINLKSDDIVNMGMAKIAEAPVLLAGDIDLGGVFAQLYGTMQLFSEEERTHLKGLIINKFRGDVEVLKPGIPQLETLCQRPVVGIIPYMQLDLDDEDSLAPRLDAKSDNVLDIAIIRIPQLSNFTDFNQLSRHAKIGVRYVDKAEMLGRPDLVILPGSKNTMADMQWLETSGMGDCIRILSSQKTPIIGICGGYQMLGENLSDPDKVEMGGNIKGLGLLPMDTVFTGSKTRTRVTGKIIASSGFFAPLSGHEIEGYEIHMGKTIGSCPPSVCLNYKHGDHNDGGVEDNIMGTYLHGFFDAPGVVDALANLLLKARGLPEWNESMMSHDVYKEEQYDLLASHLREALNMDLIYEIVAKGICY